MRPAASSNLSHPLVTFPKLTAALTLLIPDWSVDGPAPHLEKTKTARTDVEWVAQVSLLRPGCSGDSIRPQGALQLPPLRFASVGMTRGGRLLFGVLATWMDRVTNGYFARTADPSTSLRFGRDDKGRAVCFKKVNQWMKQKQT